SRSWQVICTRRNRPAVQYPPPPPPSRAVNSRSINLPGFAVLATVVDEYATHRSTIVQPALPTLDQGLHRGSRVRDVPRALPPGPRPRANAGREGSQNFLSSAGKALLARITTA